MTRIPASIRNKNPGAMYPGPSAKQFGATTFETLTSADGVHKIATFRDPVQGAAAMFDLLHKDYTGRSIEKAITRWCGAYHVSTYTRVLEDKGGVKASDPLTADFLRDPAKAIPLAKAMAWQEAGCDFPMSDEQWKEAHRSAFSPVAPAFSPSNDVPSPKHEMRVEQFVRKVNLWLAGLSTAAATTTIPLIDPGTVSASVGAWKGLGVAVADAATWMTSLGRYGVAAVAAMSVYLVAQHFMGKKT